ncbi:putative metal-dependent hydrolase of the TIM-barrel fold protein [Aminobacter sp. MSH1]|uniref:amidohydrolase family protein n=1 Tax=Aminobacter sp. MSH1 TaxID=374606 RepID=UPI000D35C168|nr:amidohydrolase family protein [Aminobacter sp. MSH1]AWC21572.1 putative metal-dependent hydrolase of the TIM-barrel fold protein [Aminobacter sp. MSH1]
MIERIDGHCHYWTLQRDDYGWLTPGAAHLAPIYRDFGPAEMRPLAEAAGIARRILVQAAPTEAETLFLLDQGRNDKAVAGIVGWVDLSSAESVASLENFAKNLLFKGVRPMLQDLEDIDWIATRPSGKAVAALKRLGLRFDALVLPQHLQSLRHFVETHPDLPVVIDHAAKPAFAAPTNDPRHAMWKFGMAELSGHPHLCCKLSGLLTELPAELRTTPKAAAEALRPTVDSLLTWFGPDRLIWGSDWPVLTLAAPFAFWDEVTERLLQSLGQSQRAAILGGTAARFYGIEGGRA